VRARFCVVGLLCEGPFLCGLGLLCEGPFLCGLGLLCEGPFLCGLGLLCEGPFLCGLDLLCEGPWPVWPALVVLLVVLGRFITISPCALYRMSWQNAV
jgi:hypothetical protein